MHKKQQRFFLSILSGILLSLPWFESFSCFIIFVAVIPLLILEDSYYDDKTSKSSGLFLSSFLSFLIWNTATTWWISYATLLGADALIVFNSFLYAFIFWAFHESRKAFKSKFSIYLLIIYWITFEYIYLRTEISWPWLNLGNCFARDNQMIQWYEYTGTLGGTLWILLVNVLCYQLIINYILSRSFNKIKTAILLITLISPFTISQIIYHQYIEKPLPKHVVIVQPNIDPYTEKFTGLTNEHQIDIMLDLASKAANDSTDYFTGPETAILGYNWENNLETNSSIIKIRSFLKKFPKASFIIGSETYKKYIPGEKKSETAQYSSKEDYWFDNYNSALQIDTSAKVQIYHKSKLVIGVEKMPYSRYLHFLNRYNFQLGGSFGSLGEQNNRDAFRALNNNIKAGPVICYESLYGEYVTDYVKAGANVLFIITNDGWWKNSDGMRQHLYLAQIRAIETRRSIVRSANTGISAIINQRGDIIQWLRWNKRGTLKGIINTNNTITFYVKYGDYLGYMSLIISFLILIFLLYLRVIKKQV